MSQDKIVGADILLEFLEVAIHNILYVRKLYPEEIFVRRKVYSTAVHVSQHPELNEYIQNVLIAIRELITEDENNVKAVNLVFYDKRRVPLEKFVFDLLLLQANSSEQDPYFLKTEDALRTICLKLLICESYLKPLPEDCTFTIEVSTNESAHITLSENPKCENFPWIINENRSEMGKRSLLPLKTVNTEIITLQIYAMEDEMAKRSAKEYSQDSISS
ncbi:mitotic spindle assembly checkpoint protein MAD2B [Orussus abietinus]|uniref:mitotic spindle assembly checkpoint protein MAD2B n=1 Tax=Orussus abietinus TaxID=222816 RepID=UPI0006268A95|nr:mitotic spindle assembly checkpoint protein MAD2B [Orussus abietinus]